MICTCCALAALSLLPHSIDPTYNHFLWGILSCFAGFVSAITGAFGFGSRPVHFAFWIVLFSVLALMTFRYTIPLG
jgi:hypothetical protein